MRDTNKGRFRRGWLAGLSLMVALCATLTPAWSQGESRQNEQPYLLAQGRGEVSVKPDVARIEMGVRTEAKEVTAAVQTNATKMDAVLKAIRGAGVDEKDIITTNYAISPVYQQPRPNVGGEPKVTGYQVYNTVRVTVRKIADAGKVLDAATQAGANIAHGISFDLSEEARSKAYGDALTKAVTEARQKAVAIAKAANLTELILHSITEQAGFSAPMQMAAFGGERAADVQTPVAAGQMTVSASVTVRFLIQVGRTESIK